MPNALLLPARSVHGILEEMARDGKRRADPPSIDEVKTMSATITIPADLEQRIARFAAAQGKNLQQMAIEALVMIFDEACTMSFKVVVEQEAEEDMKEAVRWIAQYSPDKATLWYFDATAGN